ncbi:unnamed protein product [Urochloa humidicola]
MVDNAYSKWASFFRTMCGKFSLKHHIDGSSPPQPDDPMWDQADCCIRTWIFGSVDNYVLDIAMDSDNQTVRDLWLTIERIFRAKADLTPSSSARSSTP